jgi:hypothetical protein
VHRFLRSRRFGPCVCLLYWVTIQNEPSNGHVKQRNGLGFRVRTLPFQKSCRVQDNVEKYGTVGQATDDNTVRRMRFACWITKATHKHTHTRSEYVILIAFPRQRWLRERASVVRCIYVGCFSLTSLLSALSYWPKTAGGPKHKATLPCSSLTLGQRNVTRTVLADWFRALQSALCSPTAAASPDCRPVSLHSVSRATHKCKCARRVRPVSVYCNGRAFDI